MIFVSFSTQQFTIFFYYLCNIILTIRSTIIDNTNLYSLCSNMFKCAAGPC